MTRCAMLIIVPESVNRHELKERTVTCSPFASIITQPELGLHHLHKLMNYFHCDRFCSLRSFTGVRHAVLHVKLHNSSKE